MNGTDLPGLGLDRTRRWALRVGIVALGACAVGAGVDPKHFFEAYLMAYLFWLGLALGCMVIVMIHHLAGGRWGFVVRRLLEAASRTLPLLAVLFLPCMLGLHSLYPWTNPETVAADELLQHKQPYLNLPFFLARVVIYFAVWLGTMVLLDWAGRLQDQAPSRRATRRLVLISALGLVMYMLTMTFAGVDWAMSLEPHWFSTMYGLLILTGQVLGGFAAVIVVAAWLGKRPPYAGVVGPQQFHDLGNFLLTFIIFWAYIAFSQFLIVWSGNLADENFWYLRRFANGWSRVGLTLVVLHFFAPFFLLLSREVKRRASWLWKVALGIFVMGTVDIFWVVAPGFGRTGFTLYWMDVVAPVGIGGLWVAAFIAQLQARSLVPVHDSRVEEELEWA